MGSFMICIPCHILVEWLIEEW